MDNQALAVLLAVALFGAMAIGVISRSESVQLDAPRYTASAASYSRN